MPNNNPHNSEDREPRGLHPATQFSRPLGMVHKLYLTGEIVEPSHYVEWFELIRSAGEDDVIILHINSPGGNGFTAIQFLRVLMETRATTIASVEGMCMSAATFLFLAAKQHQITDHSVFLFHNYSGGALGKGGELHAQVIHQRSWSQKLAATVYKDFLTEDELKELLDDKDFWMTPEEVADRLLLRHKKMEALKNDFLRATEPPVPVVPVVPTAPVSSPEANLLKAIMGTRPKVKAKPKKKKTKKVETKTLLTEG